MPADMSVCVMLREWLRGGRWYVAMAAGQYCDQGKRFRCFAAVGLFLCGGGETTGRTTHSAISEAAMKSDAQLEEESITLAELSLISIPRKLMACSALRNVTSRMSAKSLEKQTDGRTMNGRSKSMKEGNVNG